MVTHKYKRKVGTGKDRTGFCWRAVLPAYAGAYYLPAPSAPLEFALALRGSKVNHHVNPNPNRLPRVVASSYLNTAPLIWSFVHGSKANAVELSVDKAPARCAEMLAADEVDAALVPVIEYQRIPEIAVVPDVCVGSRNAVRSVVIASKQNELMNVRRVALDDSSRTSVALVKIIFREFLGFEPEWQSCPPDLKTMLENNDAALIIGDPAIMIPREELRVFDVVKLWREHTGCGFVFAMWMARANNAGRISTIDFAAARDEALAHLDEIVSDYQTRIALSGDEIKRYLTDNIAFRLEEDMRKGLELYFDLARKHELIDHAKPLDFLT